MTWRKQTSNPDSIKNLAIDLLQEEAKRSNAVPSEITISVEFDPTNPFTLGENKQPVLIIDSDRRPKIEYIANIDGEAHRILQDAVSNYINAVTNPQKDETSSTSSTTSSSEGSSQLSPAEQLLITSASVTTNIVEQQIQENTTPKNKKLWQNVVEAVRKLISRPNSTPLHNESLENPTKRDVTFSLNDFDKKLLMELEALGSALKGKELSEEAKDRLIKELANALIAKNSSLIGTMAQLVNNNETISLEDLEQLENLDEAEKEKRARAFLEEVNENGIPDPEIEDIANLIAKANADTIVGEKGFKEKLMPWLKKLGWVAIIIAGATILAPFLPSIGTISYLATGIKFASLCASGYQAIKSVREIRKLDTVKNKKELYFYILGSSVVGLVAGLITPALSPVGNVLLRGGLQLATPVLINRILEDKLKHSDTTRFVDARNEAETYIEQLKETAHLINQLPPEFLLKHFPLLAQLASINSDDYIAKLIKYLHLLEKEDRKRAYGILKELDRLHGILNSEVSTQEQQENASDSQQQAQSKSVVKDMLGSVPNNILQALESPDSQLNISGFKPELKTIREYTQIKAAVANTLRASTSALSLGMLLGSFAGHKILSQDIKSHPSSNEISKSNEQPNAPSDNSGDNTRLSGASNIHSGNASGAGRVYGETSVGDHRAPPSGYEDRYNTVNGTHPGSNASGSISFNPHTTPTGAQIYEPPESSQSHVFSSMADPLYRQPGVGNLHEQVAQLAHNVPDNPGEVIAQLASHNPPSTGLEPYYEFFGKTSHWHQVFGQAPSGALMGSLASKVLHMDNATRFLLHNLLRQINADDPYVFAQLSHLMYLAEKGGHDYNWILQQLQVPASSTNVQILKAILAILMPKS